MIGKERKGRYCSLCSSNHCPEANIDYTIGCCICFSQKEIERGIEPIDWCEECEIYNDEGEEVVYD